MLVKVVKSVEAMTLAAVDSNSTKLKKIVTGEIVSPSWKHRSQINDQSSFLAI